MIYVVQPGDTLWKIAVDFDVSLERLMSDNGIAAPTDLTVGQAIIILIPEKVYTILPGDTLASISEKTGVSQMEILQKNPDLIGAPYLYPGQTVILSFEGEKKREASINGYAYPYIQRGLLERTLPYLTYLTIFGYGFTEDGELIGIDDQWMINLAYQYKTAPVMLLSSITESGNFSGEKASLLFQDEALQNKVLARIVAVMKEKGYLGLDVDFEYINQENASAYIRFLENVTQTLHAEGFFVNTDLAPKTSAGQQGLLYESHDYGAIGAISDTVLIMTYEWGYAYGPPMAVAPINKVRQVVQYAVTEIEPSKILMGIPNYAYDWILPFERGVTRATTIGNEYAVQVAAKNNVPIQFDATAQSPFFYYSRDGLRHVVWFEDVRSIQAKFQLMDEFSLLGGGYWNLMKPFSQNWALLSTWYYVRKLIA